MSNRFQNIKPTSLTIFLLPITLIIALMIIGSLPGVPEGDTTYAWLPMMLIIPVTIAMVTLVSISKLKSEKLRLYLCLAIPASIYILAFIPPDGIPRVFLSVSVWFGLLLVNLLPALFSLYRSKPLADELE